MTKQQLLARRDYFNLAHDVTLRAIGLFADSELDFRPRAEMRTPRELIFHIYCQERVLAEAAQRGELTLEMANRSNPEHPSSAEMMRPLKTVADLLDYAGQCHRTADGIFRRMSEEQVASAVESPFGVHPAWQYFILAYDEHWHHRGQLYSYLRLLGKEPPMLYAYQPPDV